MCSTLANTKSLAISNAGEDLEPWAHLGTAVGNGDQWATLRKNLSYGIFDNVHTLQSKNSAPVHVDQDPSRRTPSVTHIMANRRMKNILV